MNDCCLSEETRRYYNNFAYHLAKNVIEKYMNKKENSDLIDVFDHILHDLDDVFPSEDNNWNYLFERKLIELGFFFEADKRKVAEIKKIYDKKAKESIADREKDNKSFKQLQGRLK